MRRVVQTIQSTYRFDEFGSCEEKKRICTKEHAVRKGRDGENLDSGENLELHDSY